VKPGWDCIAAGAPALHLRARLAGEGISATLRRFTSPTQDIHEYVFRKKEEQKPRWYVIDASNQVLGKVAVKAANVLRGKIKPTFTRHVDAGDFVVVVNAEKVVLTGKKETAKTYMTYSQYPGKEKYRTVKQVRASHPEKLIEHAVKGHDPEEPAGPTDDHQAQGLRRHGASPHRAKTRTHFHLVFYCHGNCISTNQRIHRNRPPQDQCRARAPGARHRQSCCQ
jgi:large subunit ribosomal protein L13